MMRRAERDRDRDERRGERGERGDRDERRGERGDRGDRPRDRDRRGRDDSDQNDNAVEN
jgi:hypothetical protein